MIDPQPVPSGAPSMSDPTGLHRIVVVVAVLAAGCVGEVVGDPDRPGEVGARDGGAAGDAGTVDRLDGGGATAEDGGADPDGGSAPLDGGPPPADGGPPPVPGDFAELDGVVAFEVEHFHEETNTDRVAARWYTFRAGSPDPVVTCVVDTPCTRDNRPDCNEYPTCDGDAIDPAEAIGGAYVEALPDRRRDDHEANTGNLGVVGPGGGPILHYRVHFTRTGRYYVWAHARGRGPAANGLHVGLDGDWPRNDLVDPSTMRLQFPNGWRWTQNRRGGRQHTGVSGTDTVSRRDANVWLEIDTPGLHVIQLGMREDGLELDKIVMTTDPDFEPTGDGPDETLR